MSGRLELTGTQTQSNIMGWKKKKPEPERVRKPKYFEAYDRPLTLSNSTVIIHQSSYFQIKASLTLVQLYETAHVEPDPGGNISFITRQWFKTLSITVASGKFPNITGAMYF